MLMKVATWSDWFLHAFSGFLSDPLSCMFAKIRSGINLKKVPKNSPPIAVSMGDTHHQLLLNALANISRVTREASPDSDDVSDSDFDFL